MIDVTPGSAEPVFVLIYGAFHGGWCWREVAAALRRAGARVFTPTMTGLGERRHLLSPSVGLATFIEDALGVLRSEELSDVVLVGHSFGGMVISGVADQMPDRISHLVYLDALVPIPSWSAFDMLPADTVAARREAARASGGLAIPNPPAAAFDIPAGPLRDWVDRQVCPHPLAAYADPIKLSHPVGNGLPKTFVLCTDPPYRAIQPSYQRIRDEPGWNFAELETGHDAMVTAPQETAILLLEIAGSSR